MNLFAGLRVLVLTLFRRSDLAADMEEELRSHIAHRADDLLRSGLDRAEAERRARIEFGAREHYREESYRALGSVSLEVFVSDFRFSLRVLSKSPGFTFAAIVTLALAIGANAVVFAILNGLFLRPLNLPRSQDLYALQRGSETYITQSYPDYVDLRDRSSSFDGLAAYTMDQTGIDEAGKEPSRSWLYFVSGNYFDALGIEPYLGRVIHGSDEHGPNSAPYVVLTWAYWHSRYQDDRGVVGRVVRLNGHPFTIIGVTPPAFHGTLLFFVPDFFAPMVNQPQVDGWSGMNNRGERSVFEVLGRLRPGVTPQQAMADLNSIGASLEKTYPKDDEHMTFTLVRPGLHGNFFAPAVEAFLAGLMLLAGLILLAACANLGSLFAARAADRSREVALRLALGARRSRILRQLFTEALLISLAGGVAGLLCSVLALGRLCAWQPFQEFPMAIPVSPDARVYLLALILALVSGFLFGAVPVRQVLHTSPYQVVKSGAADAGNARLRGRLTVRDLLLSVQIALCALLVTSSMVALRGLVRSLHARLGFEPRNTMLVESDLASAGYRDSEIPSLQRRILDAARTIPGVAQAALVSNPPLHMGWDVTDIFREQTTDLKSSNAAGNAISYRISPGYFEVAETTLLAGRPFTVHDDDRAPHVAVVNAEFARRYFGSVSGALGSHFKLRQHYNAASGNLIEVVGIVEDGKYTANLAESSQAALFLPILQAPVGDAWLVVRSSRNPEELAGSMRRTLRGLDPALPLFIQTWHEGMAGALFGPRVATIALGILGAMGAMLSLTGIFGMASYSVSKRLRELGIRMALGARRTRLLGSALSRSFKLLSLGSAAGLLLGVMASRLLAFIVYQASPRDPLVLAGVVIAMLLLGLFATWIPARRALSVDPSNLLREE